MRNFGDCGPAELVKQAQRVAWTVSRGNPAENRPCFSITVTSTPARASSKPSIIRPARPRQWTQVHSSGTGGMRRIWQLASFSRAGNRVSPVNGDAQWWDGVELCLSGLGFVLQTIVVMPVVLALAYGIAGSARCLLGLVSSW